MTLHFIITAPADHADSVICPMADSKAGKALKKELVEPTGLHIKADEKKTHSSEKKSSKSAP